MGSEIILGMGITVLATMMGASGALLFKLAVRKSLHRYNNLFNLFQDYLLYGGMLLYGISALLFVYALKFGDLSTLYSLVSLSYLWITLLSIIFLKEKMNAYKCLGITLIILAVIFIGLGA